MKHTVEQSSFATLFSPAVALAAAARAAKWDLPRHMCRPLDRYVGSRVSADLAAFDAQVDLTPIPEEEMLEELQNTASGNAEDDQDSDF